MASSTSSGPSILISDLSPVLTDIVVCAAWFGFSIPLLFLLFWTSSPQRRRKAIFIANAITVSFGVLLGLLNVILLVKSLATPSTGVNRPAQLTFACLLVLTGELIDSVLLFRIVLVFPRSTTPRVLWWSVFGPLGVLKLARLANIVAFMVLYTRKARYATTADELGTDAMTMAEPIVAWSLQILDNSYCSFIFLYWLHKVQSLSLRVKGDDGRAPFAQRVRVLFWIALSNYVFPTTVAIALLIAYVVKRNYLESLLVMLSNIYIEIFGVMFATVWAQQTDGSSYASSKGALSTASHSIHFAPPAASTAEGTTSQEISFQNSSHSDNTQIMILRPMNGYDDTESKQVGFSPEYSMPV